MGNVVQWKLPKLYKDNPNERYRVPTGHLLSPNEASSTRNGLHLIKFITKGYHGNPQITQAIAQVIKSFPQTDGKALLQETAHTYV